MAKRIIDEEMRFRIIINGNEAQKELFNLEKQTKDLVATNNKLRTQRQRLERQGKKNGAEWKKLTAQITANTATIQKNNVQMNKLENQLGVTGLTLTQLYRKAGQLRAALRHMIPGSAAAESYEAQLKEVSARITELNGKSRAAKFGISSLANGFNKYAALGASVIATLTGVVFSLQKMIDYNGKLADAQSDVQKTTGLTNDEVKELTKSFGTFTTRTSRIELLKLAEEAGRLGITGSKNVKDFVEQANKIKVALGDDLSDEAIREIGKIVNIYKVGEATGKDFSGSMDAVGSAINEVSAKGANTAGFLVDYLKRQSGIAAQAKISAADNIGYAATFDEIGQSVEVSATAMNKVFLDMFKNPGEYAKIAGTSVKDFNRLLSEDSNKAMITFLKGLNGNNEGLQLMVKKLEDLDAGGARGAQALSALAGNTKLLEERQNQANVAQGEAISLTNEYELKNNNLAATLDKVSKKFSAMFSSATLTATLNAFVLGFGKMIGAIKDVNSEFAKTSKLSFDTAKAERKLADESQYLLNKYESLTADGINPTKEAKEELEIITLQLRDRLGESVFAIDKETGAYILNTQAVKEQIKLKRLAADEEASTLASRLKGVREEQKELKISRQQADKEYDLRKKYFDEKNKQALAEINSSNALNAQEKLKLTESLSGYKELGKARVTLQQVIEKENEQKQRAIDLSQKLNDLNFKEADVDALFDSPTEPKEGETKMVGDVLMVYKGGSWKVKNSPYKPLGDNDDNSRAKKLYDLEREREEVASLIKDNADARALLEDDAFKRELQQLDIQHEEKIRKLKLQETTIAELKELQQKADAARLSGDSETADNYEAQMGVLMAKNTAVNEQIQTLELTHQRNLGTIISDGFTNRLNTLTETFEREKIARDEYQNNQLAALGKNDQAKKALQEQFNQENLEIELRHLEEVQNQAQEIFNSGQFEGFNLDLITDEQKQAIIDRLSEIGLSISEINILLNQLQSGGSQNNGALGLEGLGAGSQTDLFGFTIDQWQSMYDNFDTAKGKLQAITGVVQGLHQAWAMYNEYRNASDQKSYREFEERNSKQKTKLKDRLDSGLINQRQYDAAVSSLQKESDKRKADLEYRAAKRKYELDLTQAIVSGSMAILNGFNTQPFLPLGLAMGALATVMTGLQIATITKNKPVRGFQDGLYPIEREQDGKFFNARNGGFSRSGIVSEPTLFLAGEEGSNRPEMIINGTDYNNFTPEFKGSLNREIARVKGYQDGFYQSSTSTVQNSQELFADNENISTTDQAMLMNVIGRNTEVMQYLIDNGVIAYMSRDMENTQKLKEDLDRLQKYKDKARINGS
jgi:TP901 family phage tail tape measure protein